MIFRFLFCFIFILGFAVDTLRQNFFCDVCSPFHRQYWFCQLHFLTEKQFLFFSSSFPTSSLPIYECRSGPPHINFFLFKIRPLRRFFTGTLFHRKWAGSPKSLQSSSGVYVGCYHQVLWSFSLLLASILPWHEYKLCEKANKTENIHLLRLKGMSHGTLHSSTTAIPYYFLKTAYLYYSTLILVSYMLLKAQKHLSTMQSCQCYVCITVFGWVSSQFLIKWMVWKYFGA